MTASAARIRRPGIEAGFITACHAELAALKPGNVYRGSPGHGMDVTFFERAAVAAAPAIADPELSVGARILKATDASVAATGVNTNLGIVLLCAPLAKAAAETELGKGLRRRLAEILAALDHADAEAAFAAIQRANPAGLGEVEQGDVRSGAANLTLIEAMNLAKDRDRIANAYVTAYTDIFDFALPLLSAARAHTDDRNLAVTTLHMALLAEFPDSHLERKFGTRTARDVQEAARELRAAWDPIAAPNALKSLYIFDEHLKQNGLNPGTTADFVVATLFAEAISTAGRT